MSHPPPKTSLIIAPNWIGDTVMAQSLFMLIKQADPDHSIDVLAPAWTQPVLSYMPEIRYSWLSPFKHGEFKWRERRRLAKQLRTQHYDQAIILPNSFKSTLIPLWSHIPVRIGYQREGRGWLLTDARSRPSRQVPTCKKFVQLGLPAGSSLPEKLPYPRLRVDQASVEKTGIHLGLSPSTQGQKPILALCPGAEYGPAKRWPEEHFARLAAAQHKAGWSVWLLGSPKEVEIAKRIQAESHHCCTNLIGKSSLAEAIDLLSLSTAVVANDSGLMHVACALDKPVAALYGSTPPVIAPPLCDKAQIFYNKIACSPCFERVCPLKHFECLRGLHPTKIIQWLSNLE